MNNNTIWYKDGSTSKRKTRIIDLISDEVKERWKQEEEERKKPRRELTPEELEQNSKLRKSNIKDFIVEKAPEETGDVFKQQVKAEYDKVIERINNGETLTSKDTTFKILELQQMLRQDGIATIITMPTRTEGYKIRKA